MEESFEELKLKLKAYPNEKNMYIHQETREKLIKMGRLDEIKEIVKVKPMATIEITETPIATMEITEPSKLKYKTLKAKNMSQLKDIAKGLGIPKYYALREDALIKAILEKQ